MSIDLGRILIAVDGSDASKLASDVGLAVARGVGASVRFLHVATALDDQLDATSPLSTPSEENVAATDPVLGEALQLAEQHGVAAEVEIVGGTGTDEVVDAVLGVARAMEAALIVVGSRGRGRLAGAVLGSVSLGVLRASRSPVIVVPTPEGNSADG